MHAVENIHIYISLGISVATEDKLGKCKEKVATRFFTVLWEVGD